MSRDDDAPLADPERPGAIPNDQPIAPSGLPDQRPEDTPLGADEPPDPDGEGDAPRGEDAMPGIPTDGEPQSDG
jgi:hypothetical protein